jgi:acyl phosphate:glycerol-3-phosphate acyltransferase
MLLFLAPAAYLIGSIPFGLIVGRANGIDPRQAGSGNIGASNLGRLLGPRFFALVYFLDMLKGLIPSLAAGFIVHFSIPNWQTCLLWMLVCAAAMLGHMFSLFLRFQGGKGVATSTGVTLGVWPFLAIPALIAMTAWAIIFKSTRYFSLASMMSVVIFAVAYILLGYFYGWPILGAQWPALAATLVLCFAIFYRHRANIARLRAGTEPKFGRAA